MTLRENLKQATLAGACTVFNHSDLVVVMFAAGDDSEVFVTSRHAFDAALELEIAAGDNPLIVIDRNCPDMADSARGRDALSEFVRVGRTKGIATVGDYLAHVRADGGVAVRFYEDVAVLHLKGVVAAYSRASFEAACALPVATAESWAALLAQHATSVAHTAEGRAALERFAREFGTPHQQN